MSLCPWLLVYLRRGVGGYEQVYLRSPLFLFPDSLLWDSEAWAAPVPSLLPLTQLYPHDTASF